MVQAIIIEDEKPAARRLQRMLEKLQVAVVATLHGVEEAVSWFQQQEHPDLIFLDIQLSDGLSFDIFKEVVPRSAIIFTTAYDEYALQAFKLNSIDYLLKPVDEEELEAALQKFRGNHLPKKDELDVTSLKALLNLSPTSYKQRFSIQVGQHLILIDTGEISCFYSENKGTYLHCRNGRNYSMETSLEKLEPDMDPKWFFRVNRKFIINLKDVLDIITYSNQRLEVKLRNFQEQQIIVSRERVRSFKEWLG